MNNKPVKLYHKQLRWNVILALVSGIMLVLAFPRPALYPLGWVSLVPLIIAIRRSNQAGSFLLGLLCGVIFFGGLFYWIALFGYLPWLLLALIQSLYIAVFALSANVMFHRGKAAWIVVPALWTTLEWIRSLGVFGLTWGGLAYTQTKWLQMIQVSSITGPWGVTFLVILVNTIIAEVIVDGVRRYKLQLAIAAILMLASFAGGVVRIAEFNHISAPKTRIAMVQGGIDLTWAAPGLTQRIYDTYWPMTRPLGGKADIIIWPESALPGDFLASPPLQMEVAGLAVDTGAYMLVGGLHDIPDNKAPGKLREYNGAYLINPNGQMVGKYYKVQLVPFGEFIPGRKWIPFLHHYPILEYDRYPGPGYNTLRTPFGNLGVMICFESTFPQIGRRLANRGAGVLITITNDSWFGKTAAAVQHHEFSIFRAVENGRYVARNATTGITSLITPTGNVMTSAGLGKSLVVTGSIEMLNHRTIYTRYGDWFVALCAIIGIAGLMSVIIRPYKTMGHPR